MSRPLWPLAAVLAVGGVAALFVREGVYRSHTVADGVVVVNRFTGAAFRIKDGLREPVEPSTLENRIAKYFEKIAASTAPAASTSPGSAARPRSAAEGTAAPLPTPSAIPAPGPDDDPFTGLRHNPDFKILSPAVQFDRMKRYAEFWLQPAQSARLPRPDRDVVLDRMLRGLLGHPHAKTLSDREKEELKRYYRDLVDGKS